MMLVLAAALLLVGIAAASLTAGISATRTRAAARMSEIDLYGYAPGAVASPPSKAPSLDARAVAQRLGEIVGQRFGTASDSKIKHEILAAGMYKLTPRALVGYRVFATAAGAGYGLALDVVPKVGGPIYDMALLAGVGWLVPMVLVRRKGRLRQERIERSLPDVIDLVVVSVEAGQGFAQALATAADRTKGPLGEELRLTLREQQFGLPLDRALENLNKRADTPNMRTFVRGVVQGERLGVSIGHIMRNVAREIRLRRRAAAEERAQKTTVKILFPLVFLILPALFIVLLAPALLGLGDRVG